MRPIGKNMAAMAAAIGLASLCGSAFADVLHPGQSLRAGQTIPSSSGSYGVTMQTDGNLVVYRSDGSSVWSTGTHGSGAVTANMQQDGNFVLYTADGRPVWSTGTWGRDRVFTVDDYGRAMVIAVKKWHPSGHVEQLLRTGSKRAWVAPIWDEPPSRSRPRGPHCIGDPRACGHANRPIGDGNRRWEIPFG